MSVFVGCPVVEERVMRITHLRDNLGWAYRLVVETDEPVVVQRYKAQDVMLVPAWEWRFLKQVEADIRAGRCPWESETASASGPTVAAGSRSPLAQFVQVEFAGESGTYDHQPPPGPAHEESGETDAAVA